MRAVVRYLRAIPKGLWVYWGMLCGLLFVFALIAEDVLRRADIRFDEWVLTWLDGVRGPLSDVAAGFLDVVGGSYFLVPTTAVVCVLLWRMHRRSAVFFALSVAGALTLNGVAKGIFTRARPDLFMGLVPTEGYAFPSGHAMGSTAVALAAALIARYFRAKGWWLALLGAILFGLAVGISRAYLQVHYPSDVVAGWVLAAAWVMGVNAWYTRTRPPSREPEHPPGEVRTG